MGGTALASAGGLEWERSDSHVALRTEGGTVWAFHHGPDATKPYFHPLALSGGSPLTELRPEDHPWHLGLWFSWKTLNGVNYWEEDRSTGLPAGRTTWSRVEVETRPDHSAAISLDLVYTPPTGDPVLTERRIIAVGAPGADGELRVDWESRFTAGAEAVELAATQVDEARKRGGYAGLLWRASHGLTGWQAVDADGRAGLAAHGERSAALEFSGVRDGREVGVAMFDHPSNPRHPTPWFLRINEAKPYGLSGPALVFHEPIRIEAGQTLTLRYRIALHPGRWSAADLRTRSEAFARESSALK